MNIEKVISSISDILEIKLFVGSCKFSFDRN